MSARLSPSSSARRNVAIAESKRPSCPGLLLAKGTRYHVSGFIAYVSTFDFVVWVATLPPSNHRRYVYFGRDVPLVERGLKDDCKRAVGARWLIHAGHRVTKRQLRLIN